MTEQGPPQGLQDIVTQMEQATAERWETQRRNTELARARRALVEKADVVLATKGVPFGGLQFVFHNDTPLYEGKKCVLILRTPDVETEVSGTRVKLSLVQRVDARSLLDGFRLSVRTNNDQTSFSVGTFSHDDKPIGINDVPVIGSLIDFIDSQLPATEPTPLPPAQA